MTPAEVPAVLGASRCTGRPKLRRKNRTGRLDFDAMNQAALAALSSLLARWLPGGRLEGDEYVALNPKRNDRRSGSFRVNTGTGQWADFALPTRRSTSGPEE